MKASRLIISISLLVTLAGCGATEPAPGRGPTAEPVVAVGAVELADPESITIPALGVTSTLVPLGLDANDEHEVPPIDRPEQAGWFDGGPKPGEAGPAIILGHIDGRGKPGVFFRLKELQTGALVQVKLKDGTELSFAVTRIEQVSKKAFPASRVYADTGKPALRLITCGGFFRGEHYEDNMIVYAVQAA